MFSAGLVSLGAYVPGKSVSPSTADRLGAFLQRTSIPKEYIESIYRAQTLPGHVETNYDGWEKHPWYTTWLDRIPQTKRDDPFNGVQERRRVPLDPRSVRESVLPHPMLSSDAETIAGALALTNAGIAREDIDLLLQYAHCPDHPVPSNASLLQNKLGLPRAGAYCVDACCASFVAMLEVAETLVRSGVKRKVLIVASHIVSHILDRSDYYSVYVGDAAVAGVVAAVEEGYGYVFSHSTSDGSVHDAIICKRRTPHLSVRTSLGPTGEQDFLTFHNPVACRQIAAKSTNEMSSLASRLMERSGNRVEDIDFFVTHQPVGWAGNAWRQAIGLPPEGFYETYARYANIGACGAAVNFTEAIEQGLIGAGNLVLVASPGAGENHVGVIERTTPQLVESVDRD